MFDSKEKRKFTKMTVSMGNYIYNYKSKYNKITFRLF